LEAPLSPAMDAVIRVFKRVSGLTETDDSNTGSGAAGAAFCSIRLLVASTQAINLIGKQGSSIKTIQENSGVTVRVLSGGMLVCCHCFPTFLYFLIETIDFCVFFLHIE
jgi:poly(rC)-binding protein 2/3/4